MAAAMEELTLLERVFLRVGSAETDEQLESVILKFLPPVVLKLSSPHEEVRKKVIELLSHISKRIKTRPKVQLPVEDLIAQYQDPAANTFVTNFTIIYIKLGFPRLPASKQAELVPSLINSSENKPQQHRDSLLVLAMTAFMNVQWPADAEKCKTLLRLQEKPNTIKQLSQILLDTLLMPYGWSTIPPLPPGLSLYAYNRIAKDLGSMLTPGNLEEFKLGVLSFLNSGSLPDDEILCHTIVATADARCSVTNAADLQLRKMIGNINWEYPAVLAPLYGLYLGSTEGPAETQREPANTKLRLKMLPYMSKARKSAVLWPSSMKVLFDSLYGQNTNARLKSLALSFCSVIIQQVNVNQLSVVANILLTSALMKLIAETGVEASLRQQAYVIVGQLISKVPSIIKNDLSLLQSLFSALSEEEDNDVRMSVREALFTIVGAFKTDDTQQDLLMALLTTQIESNYPSARLVAVRYLASVFPPLHCVSKFYLLIASGDSQEEISVEAVKSLYQTGHHILNKDTPSLLLPNFLNMVAIICEKSCARERNISTRLFVGNSTLPFNAAAYIQMLLYLRVCLAQSAGVKITMEQLEHPCEASPLIGRYLRNLYSSNPGVLDSYLQFVFKLTEVKPGTVPLLCLVESIGCIPDLLAKSFVCKLDIFKKLLQDTSEDIRELTSQLIGCIIGYGGCDVISEVSLLHNSIKSTDKDLELLHGLILSVGHIVERTLTNQPSSFSRQLQESIVLTVAPCLGHVHQKIVGAACVAISLIARVLPLPLPENKFGNLTNPGQMDIVDKFLEIINGVHFNSKVKERACKAVGMLCTGDTFPHRQYVISSILKNSKEIKDIEIHLSLGEVLVCSILGPFTKLCQNMWENLKPIGGISYDPEPVGAEVLKNILISVLPEPHPVSKQACCIWLLSILRHCGELNSVKQSLLDLQFGFMELLSENSDIVQDVASKGLALVYESGDEVSRSKLVALLIDQLTVGRRSVGHVTKDTKLFEEEVLGKTPTGGNLSTYQELCSLASDLNQPELIYKFMHLANHNAIWNSKKGAAFGFSTIAAAAGQQLSTHLPKIIPRLYRYQFDPTPKIQMAMSSIWQVLVPETTKVVQQYHQEIFEDLITNLTAPQWRVRTSCCLALSDFLRCGGGQVFQDCIEELPKLWSQLFRVMDDVHEGTRQAATLTTRILSKLCIQYCDPARGKTGEAVVKIVLPVILEIGICHSVSDIRNISIQTISQLVTSAGPLLHPHLPKLVIALLEAAGELEPVELNRISVRLSGDQRSQDIVDTIRATATKSHYTTETVTKCVQYFDAESLSTVVPKIQELLRSSVGLGTKVASAHFVVLITHHFTYDQLQPYAGKLLATLVSGLTDRNIAVRKAYASTIGHVVQSAKDSSVDKLLEKLCSIYLEKEDETVRAAVGLTMQALVQHNQDRIKARNRLTLPLIFFAMNASVAVEDTINKSNREMWLEVWHDLAPITETALSTYIEDICSFLSVVLQSSSWNMKAQAAKSIQTIASKLGTSLAKDKCEFLISLLVNGLSGRTWDGKEHLLTALATLCKSAEYIKGTEAAENVVKVLLRECSKENISYKCHALASLGEILETLDTDRFGQVYDIVQNVLSKSAEGDDESDNTKQKKELLALKEAAFTTLGKAWPHSLNTQVVYQERVIAQCVNCLESNTRPVQVKIMSALFSYCDRLLLFKTASTISDFAVLNSILDQIVKALSFCLDVSKYTPLRKEALNVLFLLIKKLKSLNGSVEGYKKLSSLFFVCLDDLSRDNSPEIKSRIVDIKNFYKESEHQL